jgi:hypothetical protein
VCVAVISSQKSPTFAKHVLPARFLYFIYLFFFKKKKGQKKTARKETPATNEEGVCVHATKSRVVDAGLITSGFGTRPRDHRRGASMEADLITSGFGDPRQSDLRLETWR